MLDQLRADVQALPRLLAEAVPAFDAPEAPEPELAAVAPAADQLDLF
jgi:hypothetical protein